MFDWLSKPEGVAALAAFFSAVATGFTAWATIEGPKRAAKLADELKLKGDKDAEKQRAKLHVFAVLMANRQSYWWGEPLQAFNLIDVVYNDCKEVREAWSDLFQCFRRDIPEHIRAEKLRLLLSAMARDLKLADELRVDDFGRVYRSEAAEEEQAVAVLQRKRALQVLTSEGATPSANTAGPQVSTNTNFPPKPD